MKYIYSACVILSTMLFVGCSKSETTSVDTALDTIDTVQNDATKTDMIPVKVFIDYTCDACKSDYNALQSTFDKVQITHKDTFDIQYMVYNLDNEALDIARGGECVRQEGLLKSYLDTYFSSYYKETKASVASDIALKIGANMDNWKVCMGSDTPQKALADMKMYARNNGITGVSYIQIADKQPLIGIPKRADELYNILLKAL